MIKLAETIDLSLLVSTLLRTGHLDRKELLKLSRCSKLMKQAVDGIFRELFLQENRGCYPVHVDSWKKTYFLLQKRTARQAALSKHPLPKLPRDIFTLIAAQLSGKELTCLSAVSTHLYDKLNSEKYWEEIFIKENRGYRPNTSHWKKAYYQQSLAKRNVIVDNLKSIKPTNYPFFQGSTFFVISPQNTLMAYSKTGNVGKLIPALEPVHQIKSIGNNRFITATLTALISERTLKIEQSSDFFILWEGESQKAKVRNRGYYSFYEDFFTYRPLLLRNFDGYRTRLENNAPISIFSYATMRCVKQFVTEIPFRLYTIPGKFAFAHFTQRNVLEVYDVTTFKHSTTLSIPEGMFLIGDVEWKNSPYYLTLSDRLHKKFFIIPGTNPSYAYLSSAPTHYNLEEHVLIRLDQGRLTGHNLITQQSLSYLTDIVTSIGHWQMHGNRLFVNTNSGTEVYDRDTGKSLYHLPSFDAVCSHVIVANYHYACHLMFYSIANGADLNNYTKDNIENMYAHEGFIKGKEEVLDLHGPLPPKNLVMKSFYALTSFFKK